MYKRLSFIFSLLLGFALAFLWLMPIAVQPNNAQTPNGSSRNTSESTIVILLDNSGSMGKCPHKDAQGECTLGPEKQYRIDEAKEIISSRLKESNFSSTKLGLVEFGNYKGYGLPWRDRCKAVKILVEPGFNNETKIIRALDQVKPNDDGATPAKSAITFLVNYFKRQKLLPAKIWMISDGEPNCKDDFEVDVCGMIGTLNVDQPIEFNLDIIGYKASGKDSQFVECAKKYSGMVSYVSANSPEELDEELEEKIKEALPPPTPPAWECQLKTWSTRRFIVFYVGIFLINTLVVYLGYLICVSFGKIRAYLTIRYVIQLYTYMIIAGIITGLLLALIVALSPRCGQ